ncbi:ferrous iron transport protein B [Thermicanus aegyptius]|uniref:ferrous iron transport protein B n=1 Tax=Thermicanus aegyptius TaxID=94009 RepID=UPI000419347C|nr:ferrous iron transport protein B [Thermicanus aegyptius]
MKIALYGNPNTGKTSLFNLLTGSYEYIGNWSGVTVEKKVGMLREDLGELVDLPGIYSLNPLSKDEEVASTYLLEESFTGILNIVDASQLSRNLHLTLQLLEFGKPIILALNMVDVAQKRGLKIDVESLSERLGIPVIPIVARTGNGRADLLDLLRGWKRNSEPEKKGVQSNSPILPVFYGAEVEKCIDRMGILLEEKSPVLKRFLILRYLEGNQVVKNELEKSIPPERLSQVMMELAERLGLKGREELSDYLHHIRQERIDQLLSDVVIHEKGKEITLTERIDRWVTHPFWGMPIFLLVMFLMFQLTFDWLGSPLSDLLDAFFSGPLRDGLSYLLTEAGASPFIQSVVLDGILAGVGGVLVFVPQIFLLFFFISLIEDSGYMARVALVMDGIMEKIGLNGKAFIPMIIGFGCNVPGVMAARTIEQPKERLLTILLTPLMSCSARLSVYSLFVGAFFQRYQALVVLSLYLLGIAVAMIMAWLFSSTILKEEASVFVVELPPYRLPHGITLWRSTWEKGKGFIRKAGTVIFGGTVLIWLLSYVGPKGIGVPMDQSFLASIGGWFVPLLAPLGFGTWQAGSALITGFVAKEIVVSTMNILYHAPESETLQQIVSHAFTPLSAYSFMVFILLYIPCLATVATIRRESGSVKWTVLAVSYSLGVAYLLSFLVYQGGRILGMM